MTLIIKKLIYTELFYLFTGALIIFAGLVILWPNIILAYININYTLLLWMISGIAVLLIE